MPVVKDSLIEQLLAQVFWRWSFEQLKWKVVGDADVVDLGKPGLGMAVTFEHTECMTIEGIFWEIAYHNKKGQLSKMEDGLAW